MATQLLRNMAVRRAAGPRGILNELDLGLIHGVLPSGASHSPASVRSPADAHESAKPALSKLSDDIRYASERRFSALSQILFGDSSYLLESHQYSYSVCLTSRSGWNWPPGGKFWWTRYAGSSPMREATAMSALPRAALSRASACSTKVYQTCHEAGKLHFIKGSNADIFLRGGGSLYLYNEPGGQPGISSHTGHQAYYFYQEQKGRDYRRAGSKLKNMASIRRKRESYSV